MTEKEFNLSKEETIDTFGFGIGFYPQEKIREAVRLLKEKILLNWKGQNEFIDWLNKMVGEKLK